MATRKKTKPAHKAKSAARSRAQAKKPARPAPQAKKSGAQVDSAEMPEHSAESAIDDDALPLDVLGDIDPDEILARSSISAGFVAAEPADTEAEDDESESSNEDESFKATQLDDVEQDDETNEAQINTELDSESTFAQFSEEPPEPLETADDDAEEPGDESYDDTEPVSGPAVADPTRLYDSDDADAEERAPVDAVEGDLLGDLGEVQDTGKLLRNAIEAMLFVSDKPVTLKDIAKGLQLDKKRAQELLDELRLEFANHGIRIDEVADGYAFRTHPSVADYIRIFLEQRPVKLSRAQLETLSIVAYRQPITRPEADDIRGVDCGPVLKGLLERDLVRILGKKDEPGRPMLYGTTQTFLELFGLKSLQELPTLKEFAELNEDSKRKYEEEMGEGAPLGLSDFGLQPEGDEAMTASSNSEVPPDEQTHSGDEVATASPTDDSAQAEPVEEDEVASDEEDEDEDESDDEEDEDEDESDDEEDEDESDDEEDEDESDDEEDEDESDDEEDKDKEAEPDEGEK